uniref:Peptidase C1A papain C-terminal domain-containing protein n=1 Tax=Setaria digitata TaxID=48799 RepID=A0A915PLH6_9BILA
MLGFLLVQITFFQTDEEFYAMNGFQEINETSAHGRRHKRQTREKYYTYDGECGSCYAFGALGALEAYHKRKTGKLLDLSVQNVIDCTWYLGSNGCRGGWMIPIFIHAQKYGIAAEKKYPYVRRASRSCKWRKELAVAKDEGFYAIKPGDELGLQHAVAKHGPVVVAMAGHRRGFRFYKSGIYNDPGCDKPTHAVLVVGYGTHKTLGDYWIVKNSWGTHWGRNGYAYMTRNKGNMCFIATFASLPA